MTDNSFEGYWEAYQAQVRGNIIAIQQRILDIKHASGKLGFRFPWSIFPVDDRLEEIEKDLRALADDVADTRAAIAKSRAIKEAVDKNLAMLT